ncbi:hypothetical protein LZ30DRAFT_70797 [Colletotrichum cereale]|nr:hypothetical protein LZ30DRAFT_70797 [Colletotrichum cereale]
MGEVEFVAERGAGGGGDLYRRRRRGGRRRRRRRRRRLVELTRRPPSQRRRKLWWGGSGRSKQPEGEGEVRGLHSIHWGSLFRCCRRHVEEKERSWTGVVMTHWRSCHVCLCLERLGLLALRGAGHLRKEPVVNVCAWWVECTQGSVCVDGRRNRSSYTSLHWPLRDPLSRFASAGRP